MAFDLTYTGQFNEASGTGTIVFDDAVLPVPSVPVPPTNAVLAPGELGIVDFTLEISNASLGNGTFGLTDFPKFIWSVNSGIDLTSELVGQSAFNGFNVCGNFVGLCSPGELVSAPRGFDTNLIITEGGDGDMLTLTSMRPTQVPVPNALFLVVFALACARWATRRRSIDFDSSRSEPEKGRDCDE